VTNGNLDDPNIRRLFESKNFVFLSSLMKDGSPQVTPMWVDIENGYILVNTAIGRLKQKNTSLDPRVALAIAGQNNPYHTVTIRGVVIEQITGVEAEEHIDKLAKKYIDKDKYPYRSPGEERIILKIKPESISHIK
jgi:PPOX class probable F420-dependent enzyme